MYKQLNLLFYQGPRGERGEPGEQGQKGERGAVIGPDGNLIFDGIKGSQGDAGEKVDNTQYNLITKLLQSRTMSWYIILLAQKMLI